MSPERWARITEVLGAVLEKTPDERERFLEEACSSDPSMREEVARLLVQRQDSSLKSPVEPAVGPVLSAGQVLGRYRVEIKLGQGGMGAVYKAYDTVLGRPVALKILAPSRFADPESRQRLAHEARTASVLDHPNIVTIHDIGQTAGVDFIAMEYMPGKTLDQVIPRNGLRLSETLSIAVQVADALAAAHAAGLVHRDIKPSNIMVSGQGRAKVLDFGLAKVVKTTGIGPDASTLTSATAEGFILGTVAYMSPEQVQGKAVDARSDIFSFGATLYEMLTGQRAFHGSTSVETINAILNGEPPELAKLAGTVSPAMERIVRRCLEKAPERRFQSAFDLGFALQETLQSPRGAATKAPSGWKWASVGFSAAGIVGVIAGLVLMWPSQPRPKPSMRLTITLPEEAPLAAAGLVSPAHDRPALALSPDGSRLAYVAQVRHGTQIQVRDMNTGKVLPLAGTEGGHTPFFSPDGAFLAFFADAKLKKIPSNGGATVVLADAPNPWGGTWGADDNIYFNRYEGEGVLRIPADGGPVQVVWTGLHYMPELLGGGPLLLAAAPGVGTVAFDRGQMLKLVIPGFSVRYVPPDHFVYAEQGKLMAVPFDRSRMEINGRSVTLAEDLRTAPYGVAQFTLTPDTLIYASGRPQMMTSFVWVDRKGNTRPLGLPEDVYGAFKLSPDGKRLALTDKEGDIWIYEFSRKSMSRLTPRIATGSRASNGFPCWTPDGGHIVYMRRQGLQSQLLSAPADGSGEVVELWSRKSSGPQWLYPMSFSPDGSVMVVFGPSENSSFDIFLMRSDAAGRPRAKEPELFLGNTFGEGFGEISPDGHWMLYSSDQSGQYEIYVTSYPKPGAIHQISRNGGRESMWNPHAPEVVYVDGTSMYAVDVTLSPELRAGEPRLLFDGNFPDTPGLGYDIAPDGRQFLMLENKDFLKPSATLTVIANFSDELRRRVPANRAQ